MKKAPVSRRESNLHALPVGPRVLMGSGTLRRTGSFPSPTDRPLTGVTEEEVPPASGWPTDKLAAGSKKRTVMPPFDGLKDF